MPAALAFAADKVGAGYSARRVLWGRGSWGLGEFASGPGDLAGQRRSISARTTRSCGRAAGLEGLAASIVQMQALSAAPIGLVAWLASHGWRKVLESLGLWGASRLIAHYRTAAARQADRAQLERAGGADRGGAVPPFGSARTPYAPRADHDGNLRKSPPASGCATGREEPRFGSVATPGSGGAVKHSRRQTGSGVRGLRVVPVSAREARERARAGRESVGVVRDDHRALDLGRTALVSRERG